MTSVGYGPKWRIDGPPPQPPLYSILSPGVARVIEDVDKGVERWGNGLEVYPYPVGPANAWRTCGQGSDAVKVESGAVPLPKFGAIAVYLAERCSSQGIFGGGLSEAQAQTRYLARINAAFGALEGPAVERELMAGDVLSDFPHLSDANADVLWGGAATSVVNGFALLENAIADTGRRGVIHLTPALATAAVSNLLISPDGAGTLRTINGTPVLPGYGYVGAPPPDGQGEPGPTEEWAYATGPIEVRRSAPFVIPENFTEAFDRAENEVAYYVERGYAVDWDTVLQTAVLIDRCSAACGSAPS